MCFWVRDEKLLNILSMTRVFDRTNELTNSSVPTGSPSHFSPGTVMGFGWRIHCGVEVTESSTKGLKVTESRTNKQHTLSADAGDANRAFKISPQARTKPRGSRLGSLLL